MPSDASLSGSSGSPAFADAYARAGAARWGVPPADFAAVLERAVAHRFGNSRPHDSQDVKVFVGSLHLEDLALATACAIGHPAAWDHFVLTFRPELYRAVRAIGGEADHRDLADSLYAELYGLSCADGRRRSLLVYYHGRSKLTTWLRSVLAQRHVDRIRADRRTTSLDDLGEPAAEPFADSRPPDPDRDARETAVSHSIAAALGALDARDRLRVAYYYVHAMTLAQIGRLMHESEATVSRKLDKARKGLKTAIETGLRARGIDPAEVDDWAHVARHEWNGQLGDLLNASPVQEPLPPSFKGESQP